MVNKTYLIAVLFLLLVSIISLAKADFTIESQLDTNSVCPSNTIIINEIVTSTSDSSYSVSVSGSAAQFTTAVPSGFFLNSGQKQTVFLYITPSSKINPGSYSLDFKVTSQGTTKTVSHSIVVENCHQTTITVEPLIQTSCSCEEKSFRLTISNNGKYLENYNLAPEGPLASYVTLSNSYFSLASGQSTTAIAYVKTPCNVFGNYDLNFKVNSDSKYAQAETTSKLEIIPCYDYAITSEKNFYDLCENQKISVPIKITNTGTVDNSYTIKSIGPTWIVSDQKTLKLSPNTEKIFNLVVQPPLKTLGNFSSTVELLSDKGSISKKIDLDYKVDSCYGSSIAIDKNADQVCDSFKNTYKVTVKNTGRFKNAYNIVLVAPTWVKIDKTQVTLNSSEQTDLTLEVSPAVDTKASTYSIIVKVQDIANKIENQETLSLTTISQEDCFKPSVTSEKDEITIPQDTAATLLFTIENKGLTTANYVIELSGTAASFSRINPSTITLEPNKAQSLYLYLFPSIDTQVNNYTLTLTSRLKDSTISSKKTIIVKVLKSSDQPIINITKNQTNQTQVNETKVVKKTFWQSITGFFVSLFTPKVATNNAPKLVKKIPNIEMQSGDQFKIDLSQYFKDKDANNTLSYIAIKPEGMNLLIKGSIITIIAPKNFEATRDIIFYVSDGNVMVPSNSVKLIVTLPEESEISLPEENETNQTQVNETQSNQTQENQTNQTEAVNCKVYYWFDNNNTVCTYKEFCGAYQYQGLQTFETLNDCKEGLSDFEAQKTLEAEQARQAELARLALNTTNQTNQTSQSNETDNNKTNKTIKTTEIKPSKNASSIVNITSQVGTEKSSSTSASKTSFSSFLVQYKSYIILAIIVAIIIIIIMSGLGKKILDFFEEEEPKKK
jgi:uncharacterized membrane protein